MGEMAEVFNDLKKFKKDQRDARAITNVERLAALGIEAKEQSKNVFRIELGDRQVVMYYPTSGKWQHRGKTHRGAPEQLRAWLNDAGA